MRHKDLLHTVNNQFEIITSAAQLLNLRSTDPSTKNLCSQICSAALNTSAILTPYFMERISQEDSLARCEDSSNPAAAKRAALLSPTVE